MISLAWAGAALAVLGALLVAVLLGSGFVREGGAAASGPWPSVLLLATALMLISGLMLLAYGMRKRTLERRRHDPGYRS